ncbi:hypothetical protein HW130_15140 [Streptomyces sp. PKU-EA00015]|uniref:hypothetical protein n=1 Tax=Streptomyces sp. PKU-EA00015 TaxID=2748326 RepID=UPI0015A36A63|nr:hypothetical protein [Streptomyces sp. PKU-EA00015]NWF27582.1 hypothetical protein [Streptomyces sp. PKU-EA00015]
MTTTDKTPEQETASAAEPRPSLLRRLLRSRTARAVTASAVAGALLGAGVVAWRTDTLPLLKADACWDSLDESTLTALFGDRRIEAEEQELRRDPQTASRSYGQCRVTSFGDRSTGRRQAVLRVHYLDGLYGTDARNWPAEYLSSRMVALGEGLPGMVSPDRAWLAVPQQCTGRPKDGDASLVVDVALGEHVFDSEGPHDREDREALARTVVAAANGVIRDLGCTGTYRAPRDLPPIPERVDVAEDAFCGVKGLTVPAASREYLRRARIGGGADGPARTCELGGTYPDTAVRMTTIVDPGLTEIFGKELLYGGTRFGAESDDKGYGTAGPRRAVYRAPCQTGPVVFLAEQLESMDGGRDFLADVMPAYVAAEAERIGCGRLKIELPRA